MAAAVSLVAVSAMAVAAALIKREKSERKRCGMVKGQRRLGWFEKHMILLLYKLHWLLW